jgi:hypothetical protein
MPIETLVTFGKNARNLKISKSRPLQPLDALRLLLSSNHFDFDQHFSEAAFNIIAKKIDLERIDERRRIKIVQCVSDFKFKHQILGSPSEAAVTKRIKKLQKAVLRAREELKRYAADTAMPTDRKERSEILGVLNALETSKIKSGDFAQGSRGMNFLDLLISATEGRRSKAGRSSIKHWKEMFSDLAIIYTEATGKPATETHNKHGRERYAGKFVDFASIISRAASDAIGQPTPPNSTLGSRVEQARKESAASRPKSHETPRRLTGKTH